MQGGTSINEKGTIVKNQCLKQEKINLISVLPLDLISGENEINIDPTVPNQIEKDLKYLVSNYLPGRPNRLTLN